MNNTSLIGILVTVLIHGSLAGGVAAFSTWGDDEDRRPALNMVTIEASLAYKSKEKTTQPQKERRKKRRPKKVKGVSRDENKQVEKPKQEEEEDFAKQFEKFKQMRADDEDDEDEDEDTDTGEELPKPGGQFDGDEHGFAEVSKGDPYLQKLAADVYGTWKLPTLETGTGDAVGCLRLAPDGSVMETNLWQPTKNPNIDRSVKLALENVKKKRKPGETPVPTHLMDVTTQWTCFKFQVKAN